ncbi:50S ribosomal protein L24 [Coprococcus eutactus]|jgi:large subunit ribosomal protein L24|uniref:Large ribosomal subunit protein uL24 n=2 Tax=Coprococcus TaxID=33042 RepID=A0A8I0AN97_9FIRM|nr:MULTISPECIES: 50S ribosomal protein L24 [Clostridia]MDD6465171.1 50S ribosomal protein L24 [Coprococcus sp.]RGH07915.1 50S ribosomal protein L24 [Clostridium sp. AF15-31]RHV80911.1 50S ribosomal protein L24 [Clostridium sp. OF10-22XD]CCY61044.1 50S ribosomal protein L24 [Clostridium sp. CAG:264]SCI08159.1 50S ribosomal protein L24 [uncultured Coprococcus sp.]
MATLKIKKDDMVQVIAGKDKGKEGKVLHVDKKNGTVVVEGVNKVFKHSKPSMANQAGGIIEMEAPMDISNVMYLYKGKPVRVGFEGTGKDKVRVAKVDGKTEKID